MTLDLRALQHFLAINQQGGFARAARALRISQPSLSRSIALLEQQLGAQLFDRSTKGTAITGAGMRLLPHATMIIDGVERAQALFESPATESFAQLRIGLSPHLLHGAGAAAIGAILAGDGRTHVATSTGTMESLIDQVKAGEITFAVCLIATRLMQNLNRYEGCGFEEIAHETLIPVARRDHPVFDDAPTLGRLSQCDWAVPHQMSVSYRFESVFFRQNLALPKERLNTTSMGLMRAAIADWGLIGLMPRSMVGDDLASGAWALVDAPDLVFDYALAIIRPTALAPGPEALRAMAILRDRLGMTVPGLVCAP
ncbi:LysR family transcriptional regulator [Novosphingobium sp. FSY-8]|uniref:LysR family transcriptional regulator n=1 Tax=Novosphingobium ovatum TaxID=1908523 RepID=A0ABW9X966_9SPHN|nr:LysR family transcriptional regulator [Novosphingobium ovatum]NBC35076.1 LysR family transcriptional regulator [Novosphingobium ovatum]